MSTAAATTAADPQVGVYRRRWYQFSLRTLLIVITLAGAVCGWGALKLQAAHEQKLAVEYLNKLNARFSYDYQQIGSDPASPTNAPQPPGPQWLRNIVGDDCFCNVDSACLSNRWNDQETVHLRGLRNLRQLELYYSAIGDAGLTDLQQMQRLKSLSLPRNVSDAGLAHVSKLHSLERLSGHSKKITDAGLAHLAGLVHLKSLRFEHTSMTGATLAELQKLTELESLVLDDSPIIDLGLENLPHLPNLREISLRDTQVSDDGIARLQAKLPGCKIKQ